VNTKLGKGRSRLGRQGDLDPAAIRRQTLRFLAHRSGKDRGARNRPPPSFRPRRRRGSRKSKPARPRPRQLQGCRKKGQDKTSRGQSIVELEGTNYLMNSMLALVAAARDSRRRPSPAFRGGPRVEAGRVLAHVLGWAWRAPPPSCDRLALYGRRLLLGTLAMP